HDAILNRKERTSLRDAMERQLKPLSVDEVLALEKAGGQLLDVRDGIDFEGGHLRGSLNIALSGKYATWAGSMLAHDKPIVVIAEEGGEEEAMMRLGRIGFDNVAGFLSGGMRALEHHADLVERTERITAPALAEWLAATRANADGQPVVLDIRSEAEHAGGHVAGSLNIPLPHLDERIGELPLGRPVVVHCEGGYRSAIGVSLLQKLGHKDAHDLVGGFKAWVATMKPANVG
ncbi:MAG: rhodanese-like domain-containing protein, partial [Planctomycetota bacterium]